MARTIRQQLEQSIDELKRGTLTEERLQQILEQLDDGESKRQDLLYLQATTDSVGGWGHSVVGMSIVEAGVMSDGPPDPEDWPYKTVLEAMQDGWRVIKFPEMALLLDEERSVGLGCEFILERDRR